VGTQPNLCGWRMVVKTFVGIYFYEPTSTSSLGVKEEAVFSQRARPKTQRKADMLVSMRCLR